MDEARDSHICVGVLDTVHKFVPTHLFLMWWSKSVAPVIEKRHAAEADAVLFLTILGAIFSTEP